MLTLGMVQARPCYTPRLVAHSGELVILSRSEESFPWQRSATSKFVVRGSSFVVRCGALWKPQYAGFQPAPRMRCSRLVVCRS